MKLFDRLGYVDLVEAFVAERSERFVFSPEIIESTVE